MFDQSNICNGPPVHVRKKLSYTGHASTTYSVDQAISIIDWIGKTYESDECLPFAVSLSEAGELICIAEDNGEFASGEILSNCLKKIEGYNILVCVTRQVKGFFVTDMVQNEKHKAIKDAALKALELLLKSLKQNEEIKLDYANQNDFVNL
jgi:hypothetical protein